jgi:hypothetical protein
MNSQHNDYENHIRIGNRSDALELLDQVMKSIEYNEDTNGYVESTCGEGSVLDCLCALKGAFEVNVI